MKFRLGTIAYGFALLAAGMAAFGAWGIPVAAWVGVSWVCIAGKSKRVQDIWLSASFVSLVLSGLLIPASMESRRPSLRNSCMNNMKQIMLGLTDYEAAHGAFPPPYVTDAAGKPMHSWRVLILPYIEHGPLFNRYRMDEPWDGPNNRLLWDRMPDVYRCPGCEECERLEIAPFGKRPANATNYFAIVGEDAGWSAKGLKTHQELAAGGKGTLLVMEHGGRTALTLDEAIAALSDSSVPGHPNPSDGWLSINVTQAGRNGGLSNGHVKFLFNTLSVERARSALTIGGADMDDYAKIDPRVITLATHWRYARIYCVGLFVGLALWPGVGMWRRAQTKPSV
jgi:hypothetical protein